MITIHDFEQRTPEWYAARAGRFTASEFGPFLCNSGKVAAGARYKLICKKLGELAGEEESIFPNDAMKRGTALEPIARQEYERRTGNRAIEVGFISHDTLDLGCSPDGLIASRELADDEWIHPGILAGGVEIKCPQPSTHVRYLLDGGLPDEYRCQVHGSMAITGAKWWDFFSFCPRVTEWEKTREAWTVLDWVPGNLPPLHVRVERSAFTEELAAGLRTLCEEYAEVKRKMARLWEQERRKEVVA